MGGLVLQNGAALIVEGIGDNKWLILEDGIRIQFQNDATYRTGDYWLIPARTATGEVEWPSSEDNPLSVPPHGIEHHYAPLAVISVGADGTILEENIDDCRCTFQPICQTPLPERRSNGLCRHLQPAQT